MHVQIDLTVCGGVILVMTNLHVVSKEEKGVITISLVERRLSFCMDSISDKRSWDLLDRYVMMPMNSSDQGGESCEIGMKGASRVFWNGDPL